MVRRQGPPLWTFRAATTPACSPTTTLAFSTSNAAGSGLYALKQVTGTAQTVIDTIDIPALTIQPGALLTSEILRPRAMTRDSNGHLWISRSTFGLPVAGPMLEIAPSNWTVVERHECAAKLEPNSLIADVNPAPLGTSYCTPANTGLGAQPAVPSSTGRPGSIIALGSASFAANDFYVRAIELPSTVFTMFLVGPGLGFQSNVMNSEGNLCLGLASGIGRVQNQIGNAVGGSHGITLDLTAMVRPVGTAVVMPGETWYFQAWHRQGPTTSNFTDAVAVTFAP